MEQIRLDTVTPRAAPRNSFVFFSREGQKVVDNIGECLYNTRIKKIKQEINSCNNDPYGNWKYVMTDNQFELLLMHGGMMHDGVSSDEAISMILMMKEPAEDVAWLIKKVKGGKNARSTNENASR